MRIPLYFQFISRKLCILFLSIHIFVMSSYFFLELLSFSSMPSPALLLLHFISISLSKADFFITFSFLLASIQTIQSLKNHGELTALQANGISTLRVTLPFFFVALLLAVFSYWNSEIGIPNAHKWKIHAIYKKKTQLVPEFFVKPLADHTKIIYQEDNSGLHDLYWIVSQGEIWHCKNVIKNENHFACHFVDVLKKNSLGRFEKIQSFPTTCLPFSPETNIEQISLSLKSSLTQIFSTLRDDSLSATQDRAKFLTCFFYKIINPWFPFLFLLGIFAFILPTKGQSIYFSFLIGIFCYLLFYSMMKTFTILSENYFVSPWLTVLLFPIGLGGTFTYRLCKK